MQRDLEKVAEMYEAYRRGKIQELLEYMSPEVELLQSNELPWGGEYLGFDGVRQFLTALNEHIQSRVEIERFIDAGDQIVAVGLTRGRANKTSLEFEIPFVHVWSFIEGQVSRFESYLDNPTMLAALGQC